MQVLNHDLIYHQNIVLAGTTTTERLFFGYFQADVAQIFHLDDTQLQKINVYCGNHNAQG